MGNNTLPHVTTVHYRGDGTVRVHVAVDDFKDGQKVEVSGTITQPSGKFATFHWTQTVNRPSGSPPNAPVELEVPIGLTDLTDDEDVTVVARVSEVWSTVLTKTAPAAGGKAKWTAKYAPDGSEGPEDSGNPAISHVEVGPGKDQA
jgi:hypothetical protein